MLYSLLPLCCCYFRQSLCGTNCQQTTWTQTLWSEGGLDWKTSSYGWHHILSSPQIKYSTDSSQRLASTHVALNSVVYIFVCD